MQIENPFESGHIKNYILLYASVVVIMILFFIATSLFHEVEEVEKKSFDTNSTLKTKTDTQPQLQEQKKQTEFKLLDKAY